MLKFAANLSTMYQEFPFLERFKEAKNDGFSFFEVQDPYSFKPHEIENSLFGMKCVMMNAFMGENDFGYGAVPGKEVDFCRSLTSVIEYYNVLGFQKIHLLSGKQLPNFTETEQMDAFIRNLDSSTDFLEEYNLTALIEPICCDVIEDYFLKDFDMAVQILERTKNKNVKLLLDIYHLHKIHGDVPNNLEKYYPYAGHIQISQDPGRHEPFYPGGKIDFKFVFDFLKDKKHQDVIGLEYSPSTTTRNTLQWMNTVV